MPKTLASLAALALLATAGCIPQADTGASSSGAAPAPAPASAGSVMVGGAAMYANRTIVQNAASSRDHTTLMRAVQAAGLADTLASAGPYTVFAPTNAAFDRLPPGTLDNLLQPGNKSLLTNILAYHVVPGRKTRAQIAADIRAGGGAATYSTVAGHPIRVRMQGDAIVLADTRGNPGRVIQSDVMQSNGVIHVVDTVMLPG